MAIVRRERSTPDWPEVFAIGRFPWPQWFTDWEPLRSLWEDQHIRVEEFVEDDQLVVRAELPGVDPETDIWVTVERAVLRIHGERREERRPRGVGSAAPSSVRVLHKRAAAAVRKPARRPSTLSTVTAFSPSACRW